MDFLKIYVVSFLLATLVPLALIAGFLYVGGRRRKELRSLLESSPRLASLPVAEFAAYKYDLFQGPSGRGLRFRFLTYSEVMSVVVFIALTGACFSLVVLLARYPAALDELNVVLAGFGKDQRTAWYQTAAAKFYSMTFAVAYIWSVYGLLHRAADYALTPLHFLEASLQIVVSVFAAFVLWPLIASWSGELAATFYITGAAVLIGSHQALFRAALDQWRRSRHRLAEASNGLSKSPMPLAVLEGVDEPVAAALESRGIRDVAALATASPLLLFVESPMSLVPAIDLIGQAQLASAIGRPAFEKLRGMGIRTIGDLEKLADSEFLEPKRQALQAMGTIPAVDEQSFDVLGYMARQMADSLHVRRLRDLQTVLSAPVAGSKGLTPRAMQEADELEQRVRATITMALAPPALTKYRGWVQAAKGEPDSRGQVDVTVRFFRDRPEWGFVGEIRVDEGEEADWVTFDLELRVGLEHRGTVRQTVQVPTPTNSKDFVLSAPYDFAGEPEIWLQVFQKNRLLQVVQLAAPRATAVEAAAEGLAAAPVTPAAEQPRPLGSAP